MRPNSFEGVRLVLVFALVLPDIISLEHVQLCSCLEPVIIVRCLTALLLRRLTHLLFCGSLSNYALSKNRSHKRIAYRIIYTMRSWAVG